MISLDSELMKLFDQIGIRRDAYEFRDEYPDEKYCFNIEDGNFCIYYSERGLKTNKKAFCNEYEAAFNFVMMVALDKSTRVNVHV